MSPYTRPLMRWERCLLAGLLALSSGCLSYLHPVHPLPRHLTDPCQDVPKCSRDHVHIFMVHGMDPLNYANLSGVRDYMQDLGFHKTYYGQLYHLFQFEHELQRIHQEDPEARFVLIGFSFGANMVRSIAQCARKHGIMIDLVVYLGGNTLDDIPHDKPENVLYIANILASGCIWNGSWMEGVENWHVHGVWHFGSPTHPRTMVVLAHELAKVAARVPVVVSAEEPMRHADGEQAPTPRPVKPQRREKREEWDFLRPVSQMHMPRGVDPVVKQTPEAARTDRTAAR